LDFVIDPKQIGRVVAFAKNVPRAGDGGLQWKSVVTSENGRFGFNAELRMSVFNV